MDGQFLSNPCILEHMCYNIIMARSPLPPRGIFVPTHMIFHPQLPSAVLVTWIQLRCLAWDGWATPPLSLSELAALIGIHPPRLDRHMSMLESIAALSWRTSGHGKIILTFPYEPIGVPENHVDARNRAGSTLLSSDDRKSLEPHFYFPPQILGYLSIQEDYEEAFNNDLTDKYLVEAEAPEVRRYELEKGLFGNQNCDLDPFAKMRKQPSQLNQRGSHVHP